MMADDGGLKGEIYFHTYIANDLFNDLDSVTYEEREEFLILHKSLIEVYNGLYN